MATKGEETWEEGAEGEWAEEAEGSYKKPRKAKGETVQYLSDFLADAEAPRIAAHNVARELQWEAASVAADRTGGALLEQLARKCSNRVVERLCRWLAPYVGFLVYHRHGSHVQQTLLALLCNRAEETNEEDEEEEEDDDDEADEVGYRAGRVAARACAALKVEDGAAFAALACDANGSHVCRAWLCALAGAPVLAERRARRNERHSHSVDDAVHLSDGDLLAKISGRGFEAGAEVLRRVARGLCDPQSVQKLAVHASGGPTLGLLLRLLAASDGGARGAEKGAGDAVLCALFELDEATYEPLDRARCGLIAYGLGADRCGSVVMEAAAARASPRLLETLVALVLDPGARGGVAAWVENGVANFVLQALLRNAQGAAAEALAAAAADGAVVRRAVEPDRLGVLSALLELAEARASPEAQRALAAAAVAAATARDGKDWPAALLEDGRGGIREHGARALSALLRFADPREVVAAVAEGVALANVCADLDKPWVRKLFEAAAAAGLGDEAAAALLDAGLLLQAAASRVAAIKDLCLVLFRAASAGVKERWAEALLPNADVVVRCNPAFSRVANLSMFKSNPDRWRLNNKGAAKRPGDDDAAAHPTKAPAKRPKAKHHAKKVETIKDASSMRDILKLAGDLHKKK